MNIKSLNKYGVHVVLSRRNVLALLHKLSMPESERTLRRRTKLGFLTVTVEGDNDHYETREEGPGGPMHPETETFIESYKEAR